MSVAAVVIVIILIIVIAVAGFVFLRLAYSPANLQPARAVMQAPSPPPSPPAQQDETAQARSQPTGERPRKKDIRNAPLPRCPRCGNAIAYMEDKCSKCGASIDPNITWARP